MIDDLPGKLIPSDPTSCLPLLWVKNNKTRFAFTVDLLCSAAEIHCGLQPEIVLLFIASMYCSLLVFISSAIAVHCYLVAQISSRYRLDIAFNLLPVIGVCWYCLPLVLPSVGIVFRCYCLPLVLPSVGIAFRWYSGLLVLPSVGIGVYWYCIPLLTRSLHISLYW